MSNNFTTAKILTLKSFAVIILLGADNMIKREVLLKKLIDHKDKDIIAKTREMIENVVKEVEEGQIYTAKVVKIEEVDLDKDAEYIDGSRRPVTAEQ